MRIQSFKVSKSRTAIFFGLCVTVVGIVLIAAFILIGQIFWMERQIDEITWQLPATIYAEPPTISSGKSISKDWLIQYLQRLNYVETTARNIQPGQYVYTKRGVLFRQRPVGNEETRPVLVTFNNSRIQTMVDAADNIRVDHLILEPTPLATLFGTEGEKRTLVKIKDLPKHVLDAVIAIEDRRFFKHSGVDITSIGRALLNNISDDGPIQGGSTITQQLVKNLYLTPEKTMRRKISEATMAILMEAKYSKDEILEFYLNEVYLGQRGPVSIKGIGEASQLYFRKDARLLTLPEAAMLAGLIQAPSRYDPYRHPEKAKARRDSVLLAMKDVGSLSSEECRKYINSGLDLNEPDTQDNRAPYFLTYLKKQLKEQFSTKALHEADYRIISTLDYDMQLAAQQALSEGLTTIDRIRGKRAGSRVQGSLIAIEATTGKIRAFVGGRNFSGSQFDRLTQAQRQPGSSFKPFVYAAALETAFDSQSRFYTTSSLVADEPWSIQIDRATWQPQNYNGSYNGVVSLRTALAKSMNIATAKVAYDVGFYKIFHLARMMGFNNVKPYPSIALGAFEVTPFQLVQAYTAFANGGKRLELQAISHVSNSSEELGREREMQQKRAIHEQTAYLITDMLKTVMRAGTGASIRQWGLPQVIAGKTGTTNDQKDAWFIGYTPDFICLVWVGYDNNTPVGMTGAQAALPIWARFMKKVQNQIPVRDFPRPRGIVEKQIDPYTGKLASYSCPYAVTELFIQGTEPLSQCSDADHYLPIEYFVGPEPRIRHATYFGNDSYDDYNYANISYDNSQHIYTNHEVSETYLNDEDSETHESPATVDYSDESFPEHKEEVEPTTESETPVETDAVGTETPDPYHSPVLNDYEAPSTQELEPEVEETQPQSQEGTSPTYLAPKPKKKKVPTYTNKDIPEAETGEQVSEPDPDADDEDL